MIRLAFGLLYEDTGTDTYSCFRVKSMYNPCDAYAKAAKQQVGTPLDGLK